MHPQCLVCRATSEESLPWLTAHEPSPTVAPSGPAAGADQFNALGVLLHREVEVRGRHLSAAQLAPQKPKTDLLGLRIAAHVAPPRLVRFEPCPPPRAYTSTIRMEDRPLDV